MLTGIKKAPHPLGVADGCNSQMKDGALSLHTHFEEIVEAFSWQSAQVHKEIWVEGEKFLATEFLILERNHFEC